MKKIIMLLLISSFATISFATVINIPADYPTIQQGMDAAIDGDTVLVQPGRYIETINFNTKNITVGSLFLTTGNTSYIEQTVIDGDSTGTVVWIANHENYTAVLSGFTITKGFGIAGGIEINNAAPTISYNIISKNYSSSGGGGIECFRSNPVISNNVIKDNVADFAGGGIYCFESAPVILNNDIANNTVTGYPSWGGGIYWWISRGYLRNNIIRQNTLMGAGGGICCRAGDPVFVNNLFFGNTASEGGGVLCDWADPTIKNCIFWDDSPDEIFTDGSLDLEVTYCDVEGGYEGYGNIYIDPLFRDAAGGDFHLMSVDCGDTASSRCIDAGDPNLADSLLDCSWGMGEPKSDMGAYAGGDSLFTSIFEDMPFSPDRFMLLQNYPNPFNAETDIKFILPKAQKVDLTIYDLLGRRIADLIDEYKDAGTHDVTFNASNLPSGVYFYRLHVGDIIETKKMVLLK